MLTDTWPPSQWRLTNQCEKMIDTDEHWAWHVPMNGKECRIRAGLWPFQGLQSTTELTHDLQGDFHPGEARRI